MTLAERVTLAYRTRNHHAPGSYDFKRWHLHAATLHAEYDLRQLRLVESHAVELLNRQTLLRAKIAAGAQGPKS